MLSTKINDMINTQINWEFWSGYLYLAMANHFESVGRKGLANWFRIQYREEFDHALIFINYVHARGGKVTLAPIAEVPLTRRVHELYALAEAEHDIATRQMLNWFVAEQVEEEESAQQIIDNLTLVGEDGTGIFQIDTELGQRTYSVPAPLAGKA